MAIREKDQIVISSALGQSFIKSPVSELNEILRIVRNGMGKKQIEDELNRRFRKTWNLRAKN